MAVGVGVKEKKESKKQTDANVSDLLYRKEQNAKEFALTKDYQEVFEDADFISVEKAERTTVEDTDENSTTMFNFVDNADAGTGLLRMGNVTVGLLFLHVILEA